MGHEEELKAKALVLLPALKTELGDELTNNVPDKQLLKYLYWKSDVKRAAERFRAHVDWRKSNPWVFDDPQLRVSTDIQLKKLIRSEFLIAPKSIVSKSNAAVIVGRLRNNDMTDGRTYTEVCRTIIYMIDRVLEREEAQLNGIIIFHDLAGISRNNFHPLIPKTVLSAIIGHFPVKISGLYILNSPFFFKSFIYPITKVLFPKKLKERTHFIKSIDEIYNVISQPLLLKEHDGELSFDVDAEITSYEKDEESEKFGSLSFCVA